MMSVQLSPRRTRQKSKAQTAEGDRHASSSRQPPSTIIDLTADSSPSRAVKTPTRLPRAILPRTLTSATTGLRGQDYRLLLKKQELLRACEVELHRDFRKHAGAVDAALVFAQEEAGTAVCIAPEGLLLTCSHCVTDEDDDLDASRDHWLLFASGRVVKAVCIVSDPRRDLALLRIVAAQDEEEVAAGLRFPVVTPADASPVIDSRLVCVGHPGSEDLEASQPGVKTDYDVLHISTGCFRGCANGQDPQDNSAIGALMHDCWTYWGHSGAPLLDRRSGRLVGLHSSWDDETGMRRGVPLEAIKEFLKEHQHNFQDGTIVL